MIGEAKAIARADGCGASGQCATMGIGERACGGPSEYVVYCPLTTDTAALRRKVADVARAERAFNQKYGIASTCEFRMPPAVENVGGTCRAPPRTAFPDRSPAHDHHAPRSMTTLLVAPPDAAEFAPFYARYVALVPEGDVLDTLERQIDETLTQLGEFGEARAGHRYAPASGPCKEVPATSPTRARVRVPRDVHRARANRLAPGLRRERVRANAGFDARSLAGILGELTAVRRATLTFFRNLDDVALTRRGTANAATITPRALAFITAGHERHHLNILRERYV
jgi:hypothetical protein